MADVTIAGGGPVGLWVASELATRGVEVVLVEPKVEVDRVRSKAVTLHPRTLEYFAMRGIVDRVLGRGLERPRGHFGGLPTLLSFSDLDTPYPFTVFQPQAVTEEILEARARELKVDIRRGHCVVGASQSSSEVTVSIEGTDGAYELTSGYLVGADGAHSAVRGLFDFGFHGTGASVHAWLADVHVDASDAKFPNQWYTEAGQIMAAPLGDGIVRFVGTAPEFNTAERPELTLEKVTEQVAAVTGNDYGIHDPVWLSVFGNSTRQVDTYRKGRVLLAGDAAHVHFPAGGVGMNVGIADAMNLGWRLAEVITGGGDQALLDGYDAERRPVGAELLLSTNAQTALLTSFTPERLALRSFIDHQVTASPDFAASLTALLSGLSVSYPAAAGDHPLIGRRLGTAITPELPAVFAAMTNGKRVVVIVDGSVDDKTTAVLRNEGIVSLDVRGVGLQLRQVLVVRPDGYIQWASDADGDGELLRTLGIDES